MKKQKPTSSRLTILNQLCNLIPPHLVTKLARETGVDEKARTFTPWSHVVCLLFAQLTHALGLNDVWDALRLHSGPLSASCGPLAPSAEKPPPGHEVRAASMAGALFWRVLEHLQSLKP